MLDSLSKLKKEFIQIEIKLRDDNISNKDREELLKERERLRTIIFNIRLTEQIVTPEYQEKMNELNNRKNRR